MKTCSTCKVQKPHEDFCVNRKSKDGRNNRCKVCSSEYDKQYNSDNRERRKAYKREYNRRNKTKIAEYNASRKELQQKYYFDNAERLKQYQKENRSLFRQRLKTNLETDLTRRLRYLMKARRSDARSKGIDFTITLEDLVMIYVRQSGLCAITDIPFDLSFDDRYRTAAFGPSVDRIESRTGYTPENVQLVCFAVNMGKGQYPQEIFDAICRARVEKLNAR